MKHYQANIAITLTFILSILSIKAFAMDPPIEGNFSPLPGSEQIYTINLASQSLTCAIEWNITNGVIISPCTSGGTNCVTGTTSGIAAITVRWNCNPGASFTINADEYWCDDDDYTQIANGTIQNVVATASPIIGQTDVCLEQSVNYNAPFGANASGYDWQVIPSTAGTIVSGNGTEDVVVLWNEAGSHTIQAIPLNLYGCEGTPETLPIVVTAPTSSFVSIPLELCGGFQNVPTPFSPDPLAVSYEWEFPVGVTFTPSTPTNTFSATVDLGLYMEPGSIIRRAIYACGAVGNTIELFLPSLQKFPFPPEPIQGPSSICQSVQNAIYSILPVSNATSYGWIVSGGTIVSGQGTTSITVDWNTVGGGIVTVIPINNCGAGPSSSSLEVAVVPVSSLSVIDSIHFNNDSLTALTSQSLVLNHCTTSDDCSNKLIDKATLFIEYNTGEDYNYGENTFATTAQVEIIGYGGVGNTGPIIFEDTVNFSIDEMSPEQVFELDFTDNYYNIQSFEITVINYVGDTLVDETIQLVASFEEVFKFNAESSVPLLTNLINTNLQPVSNQYRLEWSNLSCNDFPNYEIQVLRLFNNDPTKDSDSSDISATVDWNEALSIETQSSETSFTLTLAEGTGYYVWRVRPIGNLFEGGIANDKNWGLWSDHSPYQQGAINVQGTNSNSYAFFYTQFNEDINWIYSRTFTEGNNNKDEQVRISENITFANGLQQARQTQAHLSTEDLILTTQTVLDFSGRPALSSMPVPLQDEVSLGFEPNFMKNTGGNVYTAEDFDDDTNASAPEMVRDALGEHFAYYSDNNPDLTIPNAEQYPFTRTLFYNDGNSRVLEQSGVGATFRIQSDQSQSKTNRTFYSGIVDEELVKVFGDEAPLGESVHKVINVDGNNTATVTYIGKDGKTLATCLAVNSSNTFGGDDALAGLSSQVGASLTVTDTINNTLPFGEYGSQATTSQTFMVETDVAVHYDLTPKAIDEICLNYCATCDYRIEISVQNIRTPEILTFFKSTLLPSGICNATNLAQFSFDSTIVLGPGSYTFTKRVLANNTDSNSLTTTDSIGTTFLEAHLDSLQNRYDSLIYGTGGDLETVLGFLDAEDVDGLYTHLGVDISNPPLLQDSVVYVPVGCDSIAVPIILCEPCPDPSEFAQYFDDFWVDSNFTFVGIQNDYPSNADFNMLITNMLSTGSLGGSYQCDSVWDCWRSTVQNYVTFRDLYNSSIDPDLPDFNIVDAFLDCVGRRIKGVATTPFGNPGYLSHAYGYFDFSGGGNCETFVLNSLGNPAGCSYPTYNCFVDSNWTQLYQCVIHSDDPMNPVAEINPVLAAQAMMDTCNAACEDKKAGFIDAIINAFHQDQQYVGPNPDTSSSALFPYSGDIYVLEFDPFSNRYQFNDSILLPMGTTMVSWDEIDCMANSLVAKCKEGCTITPIYDMPGGNLVSLGDSTELANYQNSLTSSYEVSVTCTPNGIIPWDTIPSVTAGSGTGGDTVWTRTYGGSGREDALSIISSNNGNGYLVAGLSNSNDGFVHGNQGSEDFWIVRINETGDTLWTHTYGGSGIDEGLSIISSNSGNEYLIAGYSNSSNGDVHGGQGLQDFWIIRIDEQGDTVWTHTYGGSNIDEGYSIMPSNDGNGYLVVGFSASNDGDVHDNNGGEDLWVLKINEQGDTLWTHSYGGTNNDQGFSITSSNDGMGYLVAGNARSNDGDVHGNNGSADLWVVKIDEMGDTIWSQSYGGTSEETAISIISSNNGSGYLVAGNASSNDGYVHGNNGNSDLWVIRINEIGDTLWTRAYGGTMDETEFSIVSSNDDNGYLMVGFASSNDGYVHGNNGSLDSWLVRIDELGDTLWTRSYGGTGVEVANSVTFANNGNGYLFGGFTFSNDGYVHGNNGGQDMWVVKIEEEATCSHQEFCFRYVPFPEIADSVPEVLPISCEASAVADIRNAIEQEVFDYIETQLDNFEATYRNTCVNPDSVSDNFSLTYDLGYHHYTLFYYNRAGNLIQTVPPQGVDLLNEDNPNDPFDEFTLDRNTSPKHRFVTNYEYNSLGQLVMQHTPDGGITKFYYNDLGQLRFSQNAQQLLDLVYSYTKYDNLGRIIEVGESSQDALGGTFVNNLSDPNFPDLTVNNSQVTLTEYSGGRLVTFIDGSPQRFLLNRISATYTDEDGDASTTLDQTTTYYSYDPHGNVEWLVQEIPGSLGKQYLRYEYDLVSGNVLKVCYNEGRLDQFFHRYSYDADNRITLTETSVNGVIWEKDANYSYYDHGPLRRSAIGEDKIQGIDYVYTIQGWLKALNHASLDKMLDPGKDGVSVSNNFARDVFGMQLGYFTQDFNRSGSPFNSSNTATLNPEANRDLYNGNISTWTSNNLNNSLASVSEYPGLTGYQYRYDELNRIKTADFKENINGLSFNAVQDYSSSYRYDANGNLYDLNRNGYANNNLEMDSLTYYYYDEVGGIYNENTSVPEFPTNKLAYVDDAITNGSNYAGDLELQLSGNYSYDAIGNLTADRSEDIEEIKWTVYGKVKEVIRTAGSSKPDLRFIYDASGNRVAKIVIPDVNDSTQTTITWYSRDASGNVMSVYESVFTDEPKGLVEEVYLTEQPIYGSDRIGQRKERKLLTTFQSSGNPSEGILYTRTMRQKNYEINDHLGNVRAVVSDLKLVGDATSETPCISLGFDGSGDYVSLGNFNTGTGSFTLEAWIYATDVAGADPTFGMGVLRNTNNEQQGDWMLAVGNDGSLQYTNWTSNGTLSNGRHVTNSGVIQDNQWYHVAVTWDGAVNSIFVNGLQESFSDLSTGSGWSNGQEIGRLFSSGNYDFNGNIDEVRVWNVARSQQDLTNNKDVSLTGSESGLVGYWQIQEGSGTLVGDLSASGNGGTLNGDPLWSNSGQVCDVVVGCSSLEFDGVSGLMDIADPLNSGLTPFTIEAWIYANDLLGANLSNGKGIYRASRGDLEGDATIGVGPGGEVIFNTRKVAPSDPTGKHRTATGVIQEGQWYHIAGVFDGVNNFIYVNGVNEAIVSSTPFNTGWVTDFCVGRGFPLSGYYWDGKLDELRIWNVAKNQTEIMANMNVSLSGSEAGLVAYWKLNENLGSIAADSSSSGNNGNLQGGVVWSNDGQVCTSPFNNGGGGGFEPDVLAINNYYAFGMLQPGRTFNTADYRYGYNGKEMVNEMYAKVGGNYDYGFRCYNPLISRFFAVDPLFKDFPELTTFQYASNSPILNIDLDGLEKSDGNDKIIDKGKGEAEIKREDDVSIIDLYILGTVILIEKLGGGDFDEGVRNLERSVDATVSALTLKQIATGVNFTKTGKRPNLSSPRNLKAGEGVLKNTSKAKQLSINALKGLNFELKTGKKLAEKDKNVVSQITIKTTSGTKTRLDFASQSKTTNKINLTEAKSSAKAPLTPKQKIAFPEIEESGGIVVGKGKGIFPGGTEIPPTKVNVVRPPLKN